MGGLFQLGGALAHPFFQIVVAVAQGLLGAAALVNLAGQLLVKLFGVLVGAAEIAQQGFVAQVADQRVAHGPVDQRSGQQNIMAPVCAQTRLLGVPSASSQMTGGSQAGSMKEANAL